MNPSAHLILWLLISCSLVSPLQGALAPLSEESLSKGAEVILTGTVATSRVLIVRKPGESLYLVRLKTTLESVEKGGDAIGDPEFVEIRCWRVRESDRVGPYGHDNIPTDGSRFRAWLKKSPEGFWEPLQPNGFALLDGAAEMEFAEVERREICKNSLIGASVGMLLLFIVATYFIRRRALKPGL